MHIHIWICGITYEGGQSSTQARLLHGLSLDGPASPAETSPILRLQQQWQQQQQQSLHSSKHRIEPLLLLLLLLVLVYHHLQQ